MASSSGHSSSPTTIALRGLELTGLDIYKIMPTETTPERAQELMAEMHADVPTGGSDFNYGQTESQHLRFWKGKPLAPLILFVHGGSWQIGTNLDSVGSAKVKYLTEKGYAFASINFTLVPKVTVKQQVLEVAQSVKYLHDNANELGFHPDRIILMGHSSGAHVVALLGTDESYLTSVNLEMGIIKAVIAIDGSNFNAPAELIDSPGPIANNMLYGLGKDLETLCDMSPIYHTHPPNAHAFLFLHAQRHGDIRQALEFMRILKAVKTHAELHVFEGEFFEGHIRLLLRLGIAEYPATGVLGKWLELHVPLAA